MPLFAPMPVPSDAPPNAEAKVAAAGQAPAVSREDHQHPRLTSSTTGVLNASGEATVTFTRTFAVKPSWTIEYEEAADNPPVIFKVKSWLGTGGTAWVSGDYTGCIIKGYRCTTIPTNLVTLLLGGVYSLFNGSANGVQYSAIIVASSST